MENTAGAGGGNPEKAPAGRRDMGTISYNYGLMPLYIQPIFHMTAGANPAGLWLFRFWSNHGNPFPHGPPRGGLLPAGHYEHRLAPGNRITLEIPL